jgi:hypothetical protein
VAHHRRKNAAEPGAPAAGSPGPPADDPKHNWPDWLRRLSDRKVVIVAGVFLGVVTLVTGAIKGVFDVAGTLGFGDDAGSTSTATHASDPTGAPGPTAPSSQATTPTPTGTETDVAVEDANQFRADERVVFQACKNGGAVGFAGTVEIPRPYKAIPAFRDLDTDLAFAQFGTVQLVFNLPRTADLAVIEVFSVEPEIVRRTQEAPAWAVYFEGCGGAEYHPMYETDIRNGRATTVQVNEAGKSKGDGRFDPFTVSPGEFVSVDFEVTACDRATYDVRFRVTYRTDQGKEKTLLMPEEHPMTFSSILPAVAYAPGFKTLESVDPFFLGWPPDNC